MSAADAPRDLAWAVRQGHEATGGYTPDEASFTAIDQRALRLLLGAAEDAGRLDWLQSHDEVVAGQHRWPFGGDEFTWNAELDNCPLRAAIDAARAGAGEARKP